MKHSYRKSLSRSSICLFLFLLFPSSVFSAADTWTETDSAIYTTDPTKNVGIGTADPQANLAIQGKRFVVGSHAMLGNYSPNDAAFEFQNPDGSVFLNFVSKNGGMVFGSSTFDGGQNGLFSWKHPFVFYMEGKESWRITPDNKIGIGTTEPNSLLHLKSAGTTLRVEDTTGEPKFSFMDESSTERAFIQLRNTGSDIDALVIRAGNDDIKFRTQAEDNDAQTTLFLGGSGNVGVGKTDPGQRLDVAGYVKGAGLCIGDDCRTIWPSEVNNGTVTGSGAGSYLSKWVSSTELGISSIFDNGFIGIGTTSPSAKLDIVGVNTQGSAAVQSDIDNGAYLKLERLYQPNSFFFLETGANGKDSLAIHRGADPYADLVVGSNGNVGIGTTAPDRKFTVTVPTGVNDIAHFRTDNANADVIISAAADQIASIYTLSGQGLSFGTNGGDERMRLTSSGNVGIGTTNPIHLLQIGGSPSSTIGTVFIAGSGYDSNQAKIALSPDGTGNSSGIVSVYRDTSTADHFSRLNFGFNDGGNETLMTVKSTGNVGIGTTAPQSLLHLKAATPELRLEGTSGATRLSFYDEGGMQRSFIATSVNGSDQDALLIQVPNDDIKFRTKSSVEDDTSTSMFIAGGSGNVGIGTTTPAYTLDVNGDVKGTRLCISTDCRTTWPSSGSGGGIDGSGTVNSLTKWTSKTTVGDSLVYDDGTNVGIGATETLGKLTVYKANGWGIHTTSDTTADNTGAVYGYAAGTTGNTYGVWGVTKSPGTDLGSAVGVRGDAYNNNSVGGSSFGMLGYSHVTKGSGRPAGIYGGAYGQYGWPGSGGPYIFMPSLVVDGVQGETYAAYYGSSGVVGFAHGDNAASTDSDANHTSDDKNQRVFGVYGQTDATANGASGVRGHASSMASNSEAYGVWGQTDSQSSGSYAVYSSGKAGGSGGWNTIVYTRQQGPTEFYGEAANESYLSHYGEGALVNGRAIIKLDPLFREAVQIDAQHAMQVFVQMYGPVQVYVQRKGNRFDIIEQNNGRSAARFGYRVMAKRKYYADRELEPTTVEVDQFMRPDLTEDQILELNKQWNR